MARRDRGVMHIYNDKRLQPVRNILRHNLTNAEIKLWSKLRRKQLCGHRFLRQFSVGQYILDFYCPAKRLCIELDGGHHAEPENLQYDEERTAYLENLGIKVLRFWNIEVENNLEGVLTTIREYIL